MMSQAEDEEEKILRETVLARAERLKGVARVKDEYYVSWSFGRKGRDVNDARGGTKEQDKASEEDEKVEKEEDVVKEGKKRGKNKLHWKDRKKAKQQEQAKKRGITEKPTWDNLCFAVAQGLPCEKGEACKFPHDIVKFMQEKPSALEGLSCLAFRDAGFCTAGFRCMVGSEHIEKVVGEDGKVEFRNLDRREGSDKNMGQYNGIGEGNFLSAENRRRLRKKEYFGVVVDGLKRKPMPDFENKLYIAPLTTVGNLPFRRIVKEFGADITCGEMAIAKSLVQGDTSEWSLVRRHKCEDVFGVQLAGEDPGIMSKALQLLERECEVDFVDLNLGCPIDLVCNQGAGSALLRRVKKLEELVRSMTAATEGRLPVGLKVRTGWSSSKPTTHTLSSLVQAWKHTMPFGTSIAYLSIHGRSRTQRYTNYADWDYIHRCSARVVASEHLFRRHHPDTEHLKPVPVFGNGDIMSYLDWEAAMNRREDWKARIKEIEEECEVEDSKIAHYLQKSQSKVSPAGLRGDSDLMDNLDLLDAKLSACMIGRGALIKPWLCTEIKERRHWDISGSERLDILKKFVDYGLEHWGGDSVGVEKTRRFLLEWISFTCRYVPIGILEPTYVPQRMNDRPPRFLGRDDKETLLASTNVDDWVSITEMFLGKVPAGFQFEPKHKSNSYSGSAQDLLQANDLLQPNN